MSTITLFRSNHSRCAAFYMVTGLILSLGILVALLMPHPAYAQSEQVQVYESVVIQEGDTLWDLALQYAPEEQDIRSYIQEVRELNHMTSDQIYAGQSIILPMQKPAGSFKSGAVSRT